VLSHIVVSVSDFERALGFYSALMDSLGVALRFCERDKPWAGWHSADRAALLCDLHAL
jgi:catechol 2,3-dioxygenase-like lactoylglutathione lyase family enzyme